jgi:hypothetical protein
MDLIINDNDYLLTFRTQPETKTLATTIIAYYKSGYSDPEGLIKVFDALIANEKQLKNYIETECPDDYKNFCNEILGGVENSIKRITLFNTTAKITKDLAGSTI